MEGKYFAVIDIGSNTMRLVIYLQHKGVRLQEVENVKGVTRLRESLDSNNMLDDAGIKILIATLKSFREVVKNYPIENLICAATATIRQAKNKQEIHKLILDEIGWDMRILSEQEEAYYGYLAVVNSTPISEGISVDLGGASTEVTYFKDRKLLNSFSFPFGALTLKNFLSHTPPTENELKNLQQYLDEQFQSLPWLNNKKVPLIGIGGSARNLAQIDQNAKNYPLAGLHQYKMDGNDINHLVHYLTPLSLDDLQKIEGLSKDRADTILAASIAFSRLYQVIDAESFILSKKGLREGIFYEQIYPTDQNHLTPNVLKDSVDELVIDYNMDTNQIKHVQFLTEKLYKQLQELHIGSLVDKDWDILKIASNVFYMGQYIDSESSAQHTFYLLANRTIDGMMHIDRLRLALVASFKNKTVFKQFMKPYKYWFTKEERDKLCLLGAILKFTYALDATKRQAIFDLQSKIVDEKLVITLFYEKDIMPEQYQAEKHKRHLEKIINRVIELHFVGSQKAAI